MSNNTFARRLAVILEEKAKLRLAFRSHAYPCLALESSVDTGLQQDYATAAKKMREEFYRHVKEPERWPGEAQASTTSKDVSATPAFTRQGVFEVDKGLNNQWQAGSGLRNELRHQEGAQRINPSTDPPQHCGQNKSMTLDKDSRAHGSDHLRLPKRDPDSSVTALMSQTLEAGLQWIDSAQSAKTMALDKERAQLQSTTMELRKHLSTDEYGQVILAPGDVQAASANSSGAGFESVQRYQQYKRDPPQHFRQQNFHPGMKQPPAGSSHPSSYPAADSNMHLQPPGAAGTAGENFQQWQASVPSANRGPQYHPHAVGASERQLKHTTQGTGASPLPATQQPGFSEADPLGGWHPGLAAEQRDPLGGWHPGLAAEQRDPLGGWHPGLAADQRDMVRPGHGLAPGWHPGFAVGPGDTMRPGNVPPPMWHTGLAASPGDTMRPDNGLPPGWHPGLAAAPGGTMRPDNGLPPGFHPGLAAGPEDIMRPGNDLPPGWHPGGSGNVHPANAPLYSQGFPAGPTDTSPTGILNMEERIEEDLTSKIEDKWIDLAFRFLEKMDPFSLKQLSKLGSLKLTSESGTQTRRMLTLPEQDLLRISMGSSRLGVQVLQTNVCTNHRCMFVFVSYGDGLVSFLGDAIINAEKWTHCAARDYHRVANSQAHALQLQSRYADAICQADLRGSKSLALALFNSETDSGSWLMEQAALVCCEAVREVLLKSKHLCEVHLLATSTQEAEVLCFAAFSTFTPPPNQEAPWQPESTWVPAGLVGKLPKSKSVSGAVIRSDIAYPKQNVGLIHGDVGTPIAKKVGETKRIVKKSPGPCARKVQEFERIEQCAKHPRQTKSSKLRAILNTRERGC